MSCVPSMNAYVACHTCHKDSATGQATETGIKCDHGNLVKQKAMQDAPNPASPSLFRHVFHHSIQQTTPSSPKLEHSTDKSLLDKIKVRIRSYSGESNSSER